MKLTLAQTWRECLRMWKWIDGQVAKGSEDTIETLKRKWMSDHGHEPFVVSANCFFCDYDTRHERMEDKSCDHCPGVKIDPNFCCENAKYHYNRQPRAFYRKLVELNKKRLAKKGKKSCRLKDESA